MIRIFLSAALAAFLVACGGNGFTASGAGGAISSAGAGGGAGGAGAAAGGLSSAGGGAGGTSSASSAGGGMVDTGVGGTQPTAGAGGAQAPSHAGTGGACTSFDASKPALPARCEKVQNNPSSPCNAGNTCITLENAVTSSGPTVDLCLPTAIQTTCAACRETMTCACLAADFTFDKTGLDTWKCCNTAGGPLYVVGYTCPK